MTLWFFKAKYILGSHVVLVGLIDAGFLYDAMAERYHPLGAYNKNIKYKVRKYSFKTKTVERKSNILPLFHIVQYSFNLTQLPFFGHFNFYIFHLC